LGLTLGLILAFMNGFSPSFVQFVLIAVGICAGWLLLQPWVQAGTLDGVSILISGAALVLNLSAAGGIGYPSIADSLWLLAAIGMGTTREAALPSTVPLQEPPARAILATSKWWIPLGVVCGALFVAAYLTAFRPVMNSHTAIAQADSALLRGKPTDYAPSIVNAALADPWSSHAALQLATLRLAEYEQQLNRERLDALARAVEAMLRMSPKKSAAWVRASEMSEAVYRKTMEPPHLQLAIERQREAIARYPANSHLYARLAALLIESGGKERAIEAAREALRLDRVVQEAGHRDRELPAVERTKLLKLTAKVEAFDAEKPSAVQ
jgi:tetratricopeptide (TPR) repeat protein